MADKDDTVQPQKDRGAGSVTITLDHGTSNAQIGYSNLTPNELLNLSRIFTEHAQRVVIAAEREKARTEALAPKKGIEV